jgi:hypothetical protein
MMESLVRDYRAMGGMIFGDVPPLEAVLASVRKLQDLLNAAATETLGGAR